MEKLAKVGDESDRLSQSIQELVRAIVTPATAELDSIMHRIYERLLNKQMGDIMLPELEDFLAELCAVMYRTQMHVEQIGVLSDMSKNVYADVYDRAVAASEGSAKDKRESEGQMAAQYESLVFDVRKRAYQIAKLKMEGAERQNNALRKIISSRMSEFKSNRWDGTDN